MQVRLRVSTYLCVSRVYGAVRVLFHAYVYVPAWPLCRNVHVCACVIGACMHVRPLCVCVYGGCVYMGCARSCMCACVR